MSASPGVDPRAGAPSPRPARRVLGVAMLSIWAVAVLVVGAGLMAPHVIALPVPALNDGRLALALRTLPGATSGRWTALHVLYERCGCSSRVLAHLMARRARADLNEQMLFVRDSPQADPGVEDTAVRARGAGFGFASVTPAELAQRYQIEAVPLLVVADAAGRIRYSGGYTEKCDAVEVDDVPIIDGVRSGRTVYARPVFGCAVSSRMQEAIDPLRLKYSRRN